MTGLFFVTIECAPAVFSALSSRRRAEGLSDIGCGGEE
jgi:hypothetical protein